jgi:hypothetical protein
MRVKVTVPVAQLEPVKDDILASAEKVEEEQTGEADWEAVRVPSLCSMMVIHLGIDTPHRSFPVQSAQ